MLNPKDFNGKSDPAATHTHTHTDTDRMAHSHIETVPTVRGECIIKMFGVKVMRSLILAL